MSPHTPALPDFRTRAAIVAHARSVLDFYDPRAVDPSGGFFHFLKDDGTVYDRHTRHLVSSTRYVFLWSMAARHLPAHPAYLATPAAPWPSCATCTASRTAAATPGRWTGATAGPGSPTPLTMPTACPSSCWPTPTR